MMIMEPKYSNVEVQLVGQDGNAFVILGRVREQMRRHHLPTEDIQEFTDEAMQGDYDHLLQVCMKWFNVS